MPAIYGSVRDNTPVPDAIWEEEFYRLPLCRVENPRIPKHVYQPFEKGWKAKDSFSGEPYDILDERLATFLAKCKNLGVAYVGFLQ